MAANIVDQRVGSQVRVTREACRLKAEHIAEHLGINIDDYRELERGQKRFTATQLRKVSSLLNVNVAIFFHTVRFEARSGLQPKVDFDYVFRNKRRLNRASV